MTEPYRYRYRLQMTEAIFIEGEPLCAIGSRTLASAHLIEQGAALHSGTLIDVNRQTPCVRASLRKIIDPPSSAKNKTGERDPEMTSSAKVHPSSYAASSDRPVAPFSGIFNALLGRRMDVAFLRSGSGVSMWCARSCCSPGNDLTLVTRPCWTHSVALKISNVSECSSTLCYRCLTERRACAPHGMQRHRELARQRDLRFAWP